MERLVQLDSKPDDKNVSDTQPVLPQNDQLAAGQPITPKYTAAHGESIESTLDLSTWHHGQDLAAMYARLEKEVSEAVACERAFESEIRSRVFPKLATRPGHPAGAGVYRATIGQMEDVHRKILFNGAIEACDGTVVSHDTLPVTITQIGICLVSYAGDQGSWVHRIYRRDLRTYGRNPVEETIELLDSRSRRSAVEQDGGNDSLASLARRGIMAYAERAVLLDRSQSAWRMGHGSPAPYELVTGSGMPELLRLSLRLMRRLILNHRKFVFVPSSTNAREILTIGNALRPLEFTIIDNLSATLSKIAAGHYRGQEWGKLKQDVQDFVNDCGPKVVVGVYRVSAMAPSQVFYAHVDHAHEAALIAMADSLLQEHRGFPMLVDLADNLCTSVFGANDFARSAQVAYADAGEPFRYLAERSTRAR